MQMDDKYFIVSNKNGVIKKVHPVDFSSDEIGTLSLMTITLSEEFMNASTCCEGRVSVERISNIEQHNRKITGKCVEEPLLKYCSKTKYNLYRYNEAWYDGVDENQIPYKNITSKGNTIRQLIRTLDFSSDNIEGINIIKRGKSYIYIKAVETSSLNGYKLDKDNVYKVSFSTLDRSGNEGVEFFMQKELISFVPDYSEELKKELSNLV